jgi:hypothetical protein
MAHAYKAYWRILVLITVACGIASAEDLPMQTPVEMERLGKAVELPAEVRDAVKKNAAELTPITVKWEVKSSSALRTEEAARLMKLDLQMAKWWIEGTSQQEVSLQDGKVLETRLDFTEQENGKIWPHETNIVCDGKIIMTGSRGSKIMGVDLISKRDPKGRWADADYFDRAGFDPGLTGADMARRRGVTSEILQRIENGARVVDVTSSETAGKKILRVTLVEENETRRIARAADLAKVEEELHHSAETPEGIKNILDSVRQQRELPEFEKFTYDLDPAMNYAVRARERGYLNGVVLERTRGEDFDQFPQRKLWLPRRVRIEQFGGGRRPNGYFKNPIIVTTYTVLETKTARLGDDQFTTAGDVAGMRIYDRTGEKEKVYQVNNDGQRQEIDPKNPIAQPEDNPL